MSSFLDSTANAVRVRNPANGNWEMWTPRQILTYSTTAPVIPAQTPSGYSTPALQIDRNWYMTEGAGRFFTPDRFKVVNDVLFKLSYEELATKGLVRGGAAVDLSTFVTGTGAGESNRAVVSNYTTDLGSDDYAGRAFIWGTSSARITGSVRMLASGEIIVENIKVAPFNDNFNFDRTGKAAGYVEMFNSAWTSIFGDYGDYGDMILIASIAPVSPFAPSALACVG
jgi:hypothetical protein